MINLLVTGNDVIELPEDLPPSYDHTTDDEANHRIIIFKYELSFMVRVIGILSDFKMIKSILIATDTSQQNSDEVRLVIPSTLEEEDKTSLISKS